jgi:hypothetical protein
MHNSCVCVDGCWLDDDLSSSVPKMRGFIFLHPLDCEEVKRAISQDGNWQADLNWFFSLRLITLLKRER